jgi:hypothetical protein
MRSDFLAGAAWIRLDFLGKAEILKAESRNTNNRLKG